ncbi:tripartite tricarboxylate transporter substrate binding protein [Variovorax beijingensis]|uniref:Tripartite tricarboxylate transporter substrate binding protein n=1 Tax=Variovorax beijingensis TaxID=2496117 RepID=A0A3P3EQI7_9BURK|nr:tripartite tricarboxylate transporter substrate binding protein [Variovorax beijingensis]RRH88511.1 tripartite tricarboxylate transporter substrate binding protein [Variovorax beijingensis]RSZ38755.1 tripartite tricarboxylate transporter substrate binding protein [Variovorax beijingensis]
MTLTRRHAAVAVAATLCAAAFAQDKYPSKPITLVVPQTAGGANDAIARVVAQRLSEQMGQSVIVDNRPGAGGTVATAALARARHDGYTLLLTADSAHVVGPALYKNPGFDAVKDFEPVAPVATAGYVLVANPSFPANNVAELIAQAKAHPGQYTIASAGNGTLNHLIGEMLQKQAGIQLRHVPYKGSAAAATDVVGGQVPLSVQSLPSVMGFIKAGRLKVLGVVNAKRVAVLPDVPTIGETLKGFGEAPWYALFAPAGTPAPIVAQLQAEVARALDQKDVADKLAAVGCEPFKGTAAQLGALVRADLPKWARVVKDTGATVD